MATLKPNTRIWIALISVYLIWGSTYLAILYVVKTIPPFMAGGMRFITAGLVLFVWRTLISVFVMF